MGWRGADSRVMSPQRSSSLSAWDSNYRSLGTCLVAQLPSTGGIDYILASPISGCKHDVGGIVVATEQSRICWTLLFHFFRYQCSDAADFRIIAAYETIVFAAIFNDSLKS